MYSTRKVRVNYTQFTFTREVKIKLEARKLRVYVNRTLADVSRARDRDLELRAALTQILFVNKNYILDSSGTWL